MASFTPQELESVMQKVIGGVDLARLNEREKFVYYAAKCEAAGLDPAAQPFQYIVLQGKMSLYATKTCTDMLIGNRKLTVSILDRKHLSELGIYEVHCRVTFPDGRTVEDFAAVSIQGAKGDNLANAIMKGVTKAKRRTVLSACGLGMLDETETETIPGAQVVPMQHATAPAADSSTSSTPPAVSASNQATGEIAMAEGWQIGKIAQQWGRALGGETDGRDHMFKLLNKHSRKDLTKQEATWYIGELEKLPAKVTAPAPEAPPAAQEPLPGTVETPADPTPDPALQTGLTEAVREALKEVHPSTIGPAAKQQITDIANQMNRAFGDIRADVTAKNSAMGHMKAWTGKGATAHLNNVEAAVLLQQLTKLPNAGTAPDAIPF